MTSRRLFGLTLLPPRSRRSARPAIPPPLRRLASFYVWTLFFWMMGENEWVNWVGGVVVRWLRGRGCGKEGGQGEVDGSLR